jgi:uncharacterized protein
VIRDTAHRPYPPPMSPWVMAQTWNQLLFMHWPIPVADLRPLVPAALELDTFDGQAWIGVVPFYMSYVHPRFLPSLPWLSFFPELNVRTYVKFNDKPGIYFFSLDAGNPIAVFLARRFFFLPYFNADMSIQKENGWIHYRSHRTHSGAPSAELEIRYRPTGTPIDHPNGTLDYWLTERYCLYTVVKETKVYRGEIHHGPWPLVSADAEIKTNTMVSAVSSTLRLPDSAPLLHYSEHQHMLCWMIARVN